MKISDVLGLNSRNHLYTSRYNSRGGKRIANSKLLTKKTLRVAEVRVPETYAILKKHEDIDRFDFGGLGSDFVVKPNNGWGGLGIIVIEGKHGDKWVTSTGEHIGIDDLKLHTADILAGQYAMDDLSDEAYIEERVRVHPIFAKYSYHGTPDIRVIVFNKVPVMAYVRLPTEESGGRANLFQGAAAAGIDIATGVTTYGVHHAEQVEFFPGTRRKLSGIMIPQWEEIMETAILASQAAGLGYMAADIVLQPLSTSKSHKANGQPEEQPAIPMILEINAQPGLKIQIANRAGLRDRLERVRGLKIKDAKHGIRVGKALFADVRLMEKGLGRKAIQAIEDITVYGLNGKVFQEKAKIDTGAYSSSLDKTEAELLGLLDEDNVLYEDYFRSALGVKKRQLVGATIEIAGRKIKTRLSIADRSRLKYKVIVGRKDLTGFAILPGPMKDPAPDY